MNDNEFNIVESQFLALSSVMEQINKNVQHLNKAMFGNADPTPGDQLMEFGYAMDQHCKAIAELLGEFRKSLNVELPSD